jgi:inosine/uridine nucleosidase
MRPVIIDCDPGHDDMVAIVLAAGSPEIDLLAITTVAGNGTLENTTRNARATCALAGIRGVPVAAGAPRPLLGALRTAPGVHGESALDGAELLSGDDVPLAAVHAVELTARLLREHGEPVTLVPVGPLTNVALLLRTYPDLTERIAEIVMMGGSMSAGNMTPFAEFNIWVDPEAAARVFASGIDVTMVGLDVTHRALMTAEHADRLRAAGRVGTMVAELSDFYHRFHSRIYDFPGVPVHDAMAVAHVIRGDLMKTQHRNVEVDCASELCRGRTVVDLWQISGREPNAHVGVDVDGAVFLDLLVERIGTLG